MGQKIDLGIAFVTHVVIATHQVIYPVKTAIQELRGFGGQGTRRRGHRVLTDGGKRIHQQQQRRGHGQREGKQETEDGKRVGVGDGCLWQHKGTGGGPTAHENGSSHPPILSVIMHSHLNATTHKKVS
jgi:hypothetical protein